MKTPRCRKKPLHERQWTFRAAAQLLNVPVEVVWHYRRLGILRSTRSPTTGRRIINYDDLSELQSHLVITRFLCGATWPEYTPDK